RISSLGNRFDALQPTHQRTADDPAPDESLSRSSRELPVRTQGRGQIGKRPGQIRQEDLSKGREPVCLFWQWQVIGKVQDKWGILGLLSNPEGQAIEDSGLGRCGAGVWRDSYRVVASNQA